MENTWNTFGLIIFYDCIKRLPRYARRVTRQQMQLVMLWNIWFYFKHCFYFLPCYLQIIVFGYRCHISWAKTGNTTNVVYIFLKPDFWQKFCYLITSELRFGEQNVRVENCWIWDMIWILPPINISLFSGCSVWSLDGFHSPLVRPRLPSPAQPSPAQPSPAQPSHHQAAEIWN